MDLTLKEKYILVAYDPVKGNGLASSFVSFGIAGAILLELAELKRINIVGKRIKLIDSHKTDDILLDQALGMIRGSSKDMKIGSLISKIAHKPGKFKKPLLKSMVDKRYLKEVRKRFLVFPYKRYPSANTSYHRTLMNNIRALVLKKAEVDRETILLTGLAGACKFAPKFFNTRDERRIARKRVKEIVEESKIDKAIDETIKAVQAAVLAAIIASTVATSASH